MFGIRKKSKAVKTNPIGTVTHYYAKIGVAVIKAKEALRKGDRVAIYGATTDFEQKIDSMQVDHVLVEIAPKGKEVGLKVKKRVRTGDKIYRS